MSFGFGDPRSRYDLPGPSGDWLEEVAQTELLDKYTEDQDELDKVYKDLLRHLQQGNYNAI